MNSANSDKNGSSLLSSPSLTSKTRLTLAVMSAATDFVIINRRNGTINRRIARLLETHSPSNPTKPVDGVFSSDVVVDPSIWFRLFVPSSSSSSSTSLPVLVFFHGGGFALLSAAAHSYNVVCRRLAHQIPAVVVSVNYRLSPEHRFPSQYDDGFDVLQFLDQKLYSVLPSIADVSNCFLAGDSAGANLAHHVTVRYSREKQQFRSLNVVGLISIQPFFGGDERTEAEIRLDPGYIVTIARTDFFWKLFLPEGSNRDHAAANVSGPNAEDISKLEFPKTMVVVAGFDPLQDWQRRYYQWLKQSGIDAELIEYPNSIHAFYLFPELPESSQLISQVKNFIANTSSSSKM